MPAIDGLGKYRSIKGKHWHWKGPGAQTAICYAYASIPVTDEEIAALRLTPCGNCKRRRERHRAGEETQGEKSFDAVVLLQPLSRETMANLRKYAEQKRATPAPQTLA